MSDLPSPTEEAPQESTSRKRKRIPIACGACRSRKSRCDGQRPKCSTCCEQSLDCVYASNSDSRDAVVPKIYLDLVEARVTSIESEIRQLKSQLASSQDSVTDNTRTLSVQVDPSLSTGPATVHTELGSERSPDATDGVGTVEFTDDESWAYFGPSSNIAFTRLVRRTLGNLLQHTRGAVSAPASRPTTQGNTLAVSRPPSPESIPSVSWTAKLEDATCILPEVEISRLARQFFRETGMLFPYINEDSFWDTYRTLVKSGRRVVRSSWMGLLNMILAMATSTSTDGGLSMEDRYSQSETFFNRAKTLCLDHMIAGASVESVQVMLLMTQYLQGTQRSIKTWSIHGLAIKAAFQLGLHSPQALRRYDGLERETRLRTWYGCVVLDRTLSMTFGRPPSIPPHFIRTGTPSHYIDINNPERPISWSSEENSTRFWNATIDLYTINASVIQDLYGSNIDDDDTLVIADVASTIFQVEQQLFSWQAALPLTMSLVESHDIPGAEGDALNWKFRVILTLRYHNLRVLAHRPILDRSLAMKGGTSQLAHEAATLRQMGQMSRSACLASAQSIIHIVRACLSSSDHRRGFAFLGAWWFTLYYTLNAALVIAAIIMTEQDQAASSHQAGSTTAKLLDEDLEGAIVIMTKLDTRNRMLEKCVKFSTTLRYLLKGLQTDDSFRCGNRGLQHENSQASHNSGPTDSVIHHDNDMFSSMMDLLPLDFNMQEAGLGAGDLFMSPGFIDSLARQEDLFW